MAAIPALEMRRLEALSHPGYAEVVAKAREFVARRGLSGPAFAELVSVGESTMKIYLGGNYDRHPGLVSTAYMDARVWDYITRHWPQPQESAAEDLLETRSYRQIRDCIADGVETGASSLIYGPPSSEKSFVAEQIVNQYRAASAAGKDAASEAEPCPVIYIICSAKHSALSMLKDIAREAEVWVRSSGSRPYVEALVSEFRARPTPPAIILDEAQNLQPAALETLRVGLHERTKRSGHRGCAMILLGSHTLYSYYMSRRFRYEQFFSRLSYNLQLTGMSEEEVLEIGARALGAGGKKAKLTDAVREDLLKNCRVVDPYATDAEGKPLQDEKGRPAVRTYYSSRRLLEYIRQKRRMNVSRVLAEAIA